MFHIVRLQVGAFFNKWTRDFADVQEPSGNTHHYPQRNHFLNAYAGHVPNTAPTVSGGGGPAWSGFVVTNPWQTCATSFPPVAQLENHISISLTRRYRTYGDTGILANMYPSMTKLLQFWAGKRGADGLLHPWTDSQWDFLGDWITPHGSEANITSPENILFNTCYYRHVAALAANISRVLGLPDRAQEYDALAQDLSSAIVKGVRCALAFHQKTLDLLYAAFYNQIDGTFVDTLQVKKSFAFDACCQSQF